MLSTTEARTQVLMAPDSFEVMEMSGSQVPSAALAASAAWFAAGDRGPPAEQGVRLPIHSKTFKTRFRNVKLMQGKAV